MKAIVTGGAGFIGSHLVKALLKDNWNVISVDNYSAGKKENLEGLKEQYGNKFEDVGMDLCEPRLACFFKNKDIDVIFHQGASKKNICLKDPHKDLMVNGGGTLNLLQIAMKYKVRKFVHASTGSVYGEAVTIPQTEDHQLRPVSYYGVSKLAGESYVKTFNHLYGLDTTVLRYFHVYGSNQDYGEFGGVVSIFANKILKGEKITVFGDGKQQRSFTHVSNVVQANISSVFNSKAKGQVYNCVSGIKVTINELIKCLESITGIKAEVEYKDWVLGDIKKFDVSNEKIKKDMEIDFITDFITGLETVVEWAGKQ